MKAGAEIAKSIDSIRDQVELLRGHLQGARFREMPEKCRQELTGASVRLSSISAECNRIQATISAEGRNLMAEVKQVTADKLELHPANLPVQPQDGLELIFTPEKVEAEVIVSGHARAKMLSYYDRANDDTFREQKEEER